MAWLKIGAAVLACGVALAAFNPQAARQQPQAMASSASPDAAPVATQTALLTRARGDDCTPAITSTPEPQREA
jgi:uncharacterized membrane protein YidH (DUF202 family)